MKGKVFFLFEISVKVQNAKLKRIQKKTSLTKCLVKSIISRLVEPIGAKCIGNNAILMVWAWRRKLFTD